jgi:hypothetical protein
VLLASSNAFSAALLALLASYIFHHCVETKLSSFRDGVNDMLNACLQAFCNPFPQWFNHRSNHTAHIHHHRAVFHQMLLSLLLVDCGLKSSISE